MLWLSETALFPRSIWNFHNDDKTRTNNISETYNHKINGKITAKNTNIYIFAGRFLNLFHQYAYILFLCLTFS